MNNEKEFQLMRLMVLTSNESFSDSYIHALNTRIYPCLHEVDFHLPFEENFDVRKEDIENLSKFLDQKWNKKEDLSFYNLEDKYDIRGVSTNWSRIKLLHACRYLYLQNLFNEEFWKMICRQHESPGEAKSMILRKADLEDKLLA